MDSRAPADRDAIIEQLSRLDSSDASDAATHQPPSTVRELKAELETMLNQLRQPHEPDPYADESGLRRAQELVLAIGAQPDSIPDPRQELGRIGPYELLEKLGEGGMGTVFKAFHSSLEKIVALKVLPRDRLTPQAITRFRREMKAVGKLDHPNIVRATDAGKADGEHFLVMEYVEGVDLSELLRRLGPLPAAEACELVRQAAIGLQHAHTRGLVHRDIKPNNIMLAWSEEAAPVVKILDMGLALLNEQAPNNQDLTTTGQMMGTLEYMSPEQGLDTRHVDIRADIYSLGATLYKLLCGSLPFSRRRYNTPGKLMVALATETPPSIGTKREDLPAGLAAIVDRMLAREPADRFATPAEVAAALAPFAVGADLQALADLARSREEAINPPADQPLTPTALHLSSPSTATTPSLQHKTSARELCETLSPADQHATPRRAPHSALRRPKPLAAVALLALFVIGISFSGQIIRIATNQGQIVIETDAPGVEVVIKDGAGKVLDTETKREITFQAGEYNIEVTVRDAGGEQRFVTDHFVLTRNGTKIVDARWETAKPMPTVDSSDERTVATWVLQTGGNIWIATDGEDRTIHKPTDLPPDSFHIRVINLQDNAKVIDHDLHRLAGLQRLRALHLSGTRVSDRGLRHLRDLPELDALGLSGTQVTGDGLESLAGFDDLRVVELNDLQLGDAGLQHLAKLPKIARLHLAGVTVTDRDLEFLSALRDLEILQLSGPQLTDVSLSHVGRLTNLRSLEIVNAREVTDAGFAHLRGLTQLTWINLQGTSISEQGLESLREMKLLEAAHLAKTKISNPSADVFVGLERLSYLTLDDTKLSDAGLKNLTPLKALRELHVERTNVTAAGVAKLQLALPNCKIVSDFTDKQITDALRARIDAYELRVAGNGDPAQAPAELVAIQGDSRWKHWRQVTDAVFADSGATLITSSADGTVRTWDAQTGQQLRVFHFPRAVNSLALTPNKQTLIVGVDDNKTIHFVNATTGAAVREPMHGGQSLALSPDGKTLVSGTHAGSGDVMLHDAATGELLLQLGNHAAPVTDVAIHPRGKVAATSSRDHTIKMWNLTDGTELRTLTGHKSEVSAVSFSPDGKLLASGGDQLRLWNPATGDLLQTFGEPGDVCYAIAFSPDGSELAASGWLGQPAGIAVWDVASGRKKRILSTPDLHPHSSSTLLYSADGKTLVSGSIQGRLRLWDLTTGEQRNQPSGPLSAFTDSALSPDGTLLATTSRDGMLSLWDLTQQQTPQHIQTFAGFVNCVAFNPDGKTVAIGHGSGWGDPLDQFQVALWDVLTRAKLKVLHRHTNQVWSVAFTPDGTSVVSGDADGSVVIVDVATGDVRSKLEKASEGITNLTISPDGRLVSTVTLNSDTITIWDRSTSVAVHQLSHPGAVRLAFAPDGKTLASAGRDSTICLWDVTTGEQRRVLKGHKGWVEDLVYAPDGNTLWSIAWDAIIRQWEPDAAIGTPTVKRRISLGPPGCDGELLQITPDGEHLITTNANGTIYMLRVAPPIDSAE